MRSMRLAYGLVVCALLAGGCGEKKEAAAADPKAAEAAAKQAESLRKDEEDVFARRDELQRERKSIRDKRVALAEKRKQTQASGGDVSEIDKEENDLAAKESELIDKELEINKKMDALVSQYQQMLAAGAKGGAAGGELAGREGALAVREKDVAKREDRLAQREADLAAREKAQALREKETCGTATTTTIVQQVEPPKGAKYSKRDVEPVLQKARKKMNDKGLLASDLPAPAQGLENESLAAMKDGDYGKAKFAADQLYATVDSLKIDKGFISAKINRLNGLVKGKTLDASVKKEVDELFRGATADYVDGRFSAANAKLNKIYALIR
jgi:hypothetical protein